MKVEVRTLLVLLIGTASLGSAPVVADDAEESAETRGQYLVEIGACNDCHTSGFAMSGGATPVSDWLLGDSLGFRGPWGTTYASNLRMSVARLTEDQWVAFSKALKTRPPMPWWALNSMTAEDLGAIYRFIRSLDPDDRTVPDYVPPDQEPKTPYILWPSP